MAETNDRTGAASVELVPPGYQFPVRAELVPTGTVRPVEARRPRQRATTAKAGTAKRRGGRPKKNSLRGVLSRARARFSGRRFGARKSAKTEVGSVAKRKKHVYLSLGTVSIACIFGIGTAFASDLAVQRFISNTPAVRLGVHAGIAIVFWWVGASMFVSPLVGEILKLMAVSHTVSGILIVGTDMARAAQAGTAPGGAATG